jgi:hypothetical protein
MEAMDGCGAPCEAQQAAMAGPQVSYGEVADATAVELDQEVVSQRMV